MDVVSSLGTLLSYVDIIAREVAERQSSSKQFPIVLEQLKLSLIALNELVADVVLSPQTQRLIDYLIEGLQSGVDEVRNQQDSHRAPVILSRWFHSPQLVESCESMIQQIEDIKVKMEKVKSTQAPSDYLYEYPEVRTIWKVSFNDAKQVQLDSDAEGSSGLIDDLHSHIQHAIKGKDDIQLWHRKTKVITPEEGGSSSSPVRREGECQISSISELLTKDMLECLLRPHCRRRDLTVKGVSSPTGPASPHFRFPRLSSPSARESTASNTDFIFDPFQLNRWLNTIRASWVHEQGGEWQQWEGRSQARVIITPLSAVMPAARHQYHVRTEFFHAHQHQANSGKSSDPQLLSTASSFADEADNVASATPKFLSTKPTEHVVHEGLMVRFSILARSNGLLKDEIKIAKTHAVPLVEVLTKSKWNGRYKACEEVFPLDANSFLRSKDQELKKKLTAADQQHSLKVKFEFRADFILLESSALKQQLLPSQSLVHLLVHAALQPEARKACDAAYGEIERKIKQLKFFEPQVPHVRHGFAHGETVSNMIEMLSQLRVINTSSVNLGIQPAQWNQLQSMSDSMSVDGIEDFLKKQFDVEDTSNTNVSLNMKVLIECFTRFIANRQVESYPAADIQTTDSSSTNIAMQLGGSPDQYFQVFRWYVNMVLQRRYLDAVHWLELEIDLLRSNLTLAQVESLQEALLTHWNQEKNSFALCGQKCDVCYHRCLLTTGHEPGEHNCCHSIIMSIADKAHDCPARCACESQKGSQSAASASLQSIVVPPRKTLSCSGRSGHPGEHNCSTCAAKQQTLKHTAELNAKLTADKAKRRADLIRLDADRIAPFGEWSDNAYVRLNPELRGRTNEKPLQHFVAANGSSTIALMNDATGTFDREAYLILHPDVSKGDALKHFTKKGHEKRFPCVVKNAEQIPPCGLMQPWLEQLKIIASAVRQYKKRWTGWISIADNVETRMKPLVSDVLLLNIALNIPPRIPKRVVGQVYDNEFMQLVAGEFSAVATNRPPHVNGDSSSSSASENLCITLSALVTGRSAVMCKQYQTAHRLILTHDENAEEFLPRLFCQEVELLNKLASKMEIELFSSD